MSSHSDEFHAPTVKKTNFGFTQAKLERETWLAIINSRRSFTKTTTCDCSNKEIGETPCEVLAFAPQFAGLPQGEVFKNLPKTIYTFKFVQGKALRRPQQDVPELNCYQRWYLANQQSH